MTKRCLLFVVLLPFVSLSQNVGVGTTTPHPSAMMEIQSTNKGMLVPRISLTATNVATPVTSPADALLIYNTATAGSGNTAVTPGFYYWNAASSKWLSISNATSTNNSTGGSAGFGVWGDCATNSVIGEFNPVTAPDNHVDAYFGGEVSISGNFAIVGAFQFNGGNGSVLKGSAFIYFFDGNKWVFKQKLTPSNAANEERCGSSVSIAGSYAVIGSPNAKVGQNFNQGAAYTYYFNGTDWVEWNKLTASDGAADDFFGSEVSIAANSDVFVGAYGDNIGGNVDQGSVYVYSFNAAIYEQKIISNSGAAQAYFGSGLSNSGNNLLIGESGASSNQGAAYIYTFNGSSWVFKQKLMPAASSNTNIGGHVSISGNIVALGAAGADINGNTDQGTVFVYEFNGTDWISKGRLTAGDGAPTDIFGIKVSVSGDYILVGAADADINGKSNQGTAYLFANVNGLWRQIAKVTDPQGAALNRFGISCALDGRRFIVGANGVADFRGMAFFGKIN